MPSMIRSAAGLLAAASTVFAHGHVSGVVINGVYSEGFQLEDAYAATLPDRVGWSDQALDNGFVAPSAYATGDIICHKSALNAKLSADVSAGDDILVEWNTWPESHKGPIINYLANCNGDCSTVDKTTLKWFKIAEDAMTSDGTVSPGTWATDALIANNFSQTVTIPSTIAAGNYVLRHEIIALHSAGSADGAQNYPQCINLVVASSGTDTPEGTLGTALYTETDPGILFNLYTTPLTYTIPGPALYASGDSASSGGTTTPAVSSAAVVASSTAIASAVPTTMATSVKPAATTAAAVVSSASAAPTAAAEEEDDTCE